MKPEEILDVPRAHWGDICDRWQAGDTMTSIGHEYEVNSAKIKKILVELNAYDRVKPQPKKALPRTGNGSDVRMFAKAARSILWRQDQGKEHPTFKAWESRVAELASKDGGGLGRNQAIVRASKDFKCLHRLFRDYDVTEFDPHPESHAAIQHWGDAKGMEAADETVVFGGKECGYRENLKWALDAAGEYLRTKEHPTTAPNGSAWFFYRQALDEPKDFMAKFGQMEQKADDGKDAGSRRETHKSIEELHGFLEELENEERDASCKQDQARKEATETEEGHANR